MATRLPTRRVLRPTPTRLASELLVDYEQWLQTHYQTIGTYRDHAKSFLVRFKASGTLLSQLDTFASKKSITGRSILMRFRRFLEEKKITTLQNDLLKNSRESRLPLGNVYVKLFLATRTDRLGSKRTLSTYATILNAYFRFIGHIGHLEKITAQQFLHARGRSEFTSALYASVLRSFARWALQYAMTPDAELSTPERKIKQAFDQVSIKALRDVASIQAKVKGSKLYYKESLTARQRLRLLEICPSLQERAIVALMAWNGLRPTEVERLTIKDFDFRKSTVAIWGKGRSVRQKDTIVLFKPVTKEIKAYVKDSRLKSGKLFPGLFYKELHRMIHSLFSRMGLSSDKQRYTPHSLRHTAGQLLYDKGIPLEFIQRTLRHTSMQSTLVYARKAIERSYFKNMKSVW